MKRLLIFVVLLLGVSFKAIGQQVSSSDNVLLEYHPLNSQIFQNTRTLRILLPNDYYKEGNNKKYKVLFLNDGQCLFDREICNISNQEWRVDETVDSLLELNKIVPLIVVGIDNTGIKQRGNEYLPWEDVYLDPPIPNPMGSKYPDFLFNEVLPFIKSEYRISARREDIGLGGSSYGALIAFYTYMGKPERIGFLLLESPSFYVNDRAIIEKFKNFEKVLPKKVHLGIGTNELGLKNCEESNEDNMMAVRDVKSLKKMLLTKGLNEDRIHLDVDECATHTEKSYAKRFPNAIQFLINE